MLDREILNQYRNDAQGLAKYFSEWYFKEREKVFPINPFQVLTDLGIHFVFRDFDKMEGLFMPSTKDMPIDLVAINAKRPITRQHFQRRMSYVIFLKMQMHSQRLCVLFHQMNTKKNMQNHLLLRFSYRRMSYVFRSTLFIRMMLN